MVLLVPPNEDAGPKRVDWTLAYVVAAGIGAVALVALATSPVASLLGESAYAIPAALHGVSSITYVITATVSAYLAALLYVGRLGAIRDLQRVSLLNAFFSLVTILFGNWIYIYYRQAGGPREYFLETSPAIHQIFFEFKEFTGLFTLPLSVAAAFVITTRRDLQADPPLRQAIATLLILAWLFLMLSFALGAAITKLRSV